MPIDLAPFAHRKPVHFLGDSKAAISGFPVDVKEVIGYAIHEAQIGDKSPIARPMKGFDGSSVIEICDDYDGDTYRAMYTAKLAGVVYVLHAFQKKSKKGIQTPKPDIDLIKQRLKAAKTHHEEHYDTERKSKK